MVLKISRLEILRDRRFGPFMLGYATSALGTSMASVALAFAVLQERGSPADLSYVLAARLVPMVLFLVVGGVLGDRFSRRAVMLYADILRALAQGAIAAAFFVGRPSLVLLMVLAALSGLGEAAFMPSFNALLPSLLPPDRLVDGNAMRGLAQSVSTVAGPALAGVLITVTSPATILLVDAITYLPSIVVLVLLRIEERPRKPSTMLQDLRGGWRVFWSYPWLWTVTLQFTLFNLLVWGPYLVLGPASAERYYQGAGTWGVVLALYGAGSVLGGLLILGRRWDRPLVVTTLVSFLWAAPSAAFALRLPLPVLGAAALLAGIASAVFNGLWLTTVQQRVPQEAMSRVMAYITFGAYSVGPAGMTLAGPVSQAVGIAPVLVTGVVWQVLATSVVLTLPAIRAVRRPETPAEPLVRA
ncbi:MFS transporter [Micromonospora sp. DT4]|uniref:MFS transporter n=1 Tax=Micromonospora sp. DT4 TaxID=3393438 RepID=UPI003CE94324